MKLITNVGWCWTPRCELCIVCTGRRLLQAQLDGVGDEACNTCLDWMAQLIPMEQVRDEQGLECLWRGQLEFCNGRIEFGLDATFSPGDVLLEGSVYEIAIDEGTVPPLSPGQEVLPGEEAFVGDWRLLVPNVSAVNCDFNVVKLGGFVESAYTDSFGYQQCNWAGSEMTITISPCEEAIV